MSQFFNKINYSSSNEDGAIEREALAAKLTGGQVLCITGSGSRPLELAIARPQKIVSVDFNPTQNHLLALKIAAYQMLEYEDMLGFFGLTKSDQRLRTFQYLSSKLSRESQAFWESRPSLIQNGILYAGSWEHYLAAIARAATFFRGDLINELLSFDDLKSQAQFWDSKWDTSAWKAFIRIIGYRPLWEYVIREPGIHLVPKDAKIWQILKDRFDMAAHNILFKKSPFAWLILKGRYNVSVALPCHLQEKHFATLKNEVQNIEIQTVDLAEHLKTTSDRYDAFSLSDFGSYAPQAMYRSIWFGVNRCARDGARVCEREFLVPRLPEQLAGNRLKREPELETRLAKLDHSMIYKFIVGAIEGEKK